MQLTVVFLLEGCSQGEDHALGKSDALPRLSQGLKKSPHSQYGRPVSLVTHHPMASQLTLRALSPGAHSDGISGGS